MPENENDNTQIPEAFRIFLEWKSIAVEAFADLSDGLTPKVITKSGTGALSVALDYVDGHTWDQIAGKAFPSFPTSPLGMHIATKEALFLVSSNVCMHSQAGAWEREN